MSTTESGRAQVQIPNIIEKYRKQAVDLEQVGGVDKPAAPAERTETGDILADWEATWIGDMLDTPPPDREWVVDGLVPQDTAVALAAGGGTGKSFLTLQAAFAIATGRDFLGFRVPRPGAVLLLNAEDDRNEIHRRVSAIANRARMDGELDRYGEQAVRENLRVLSLVGRDNRITTANSGSVSRTAFSDRLKRMVGDRELRLIVIDPISRFRGGDENSNDHMTYFVEAVEGLRQELGTTVMIVHHFSKQGLRNGTAMSASDMRGGSALLDGVRCALAMATMPRDMAGKFGLPEENAKRYVRLDGVKANYGEPWDGMWLQRAEGGVLVKADLVEVDQVEFRKDVRGQAYEAAKSRVMEQVDRWQRAGRPLTQRAIRNDAGVDGPYKVSDDTIRKILTELIRDKQIIPIGDHHNGGKLLGVGQWDGVVG